MKKQWVIIASALIVVGLIGLFFTKFDFSDKKNQRFEHEWEFGNISLDQLKLISDSNDISVQFVESHDDKIYVTANGHVNRDVLEKLGNINIVNGEFVLDFSGNKSFQFLSFGNREDDITIKIALPKSNVLKQLSVKMASGDIYLNHIVTENINFDVISGDIQLNNSQAEYLKASCISCDVKIGNHKGNIEIDAKSGDIEINQLAGQSNIQTISGDIELIQHDHTDATINSKSGDIEVTQLKEGRINIDVISGDVDVQIASEFAGNLSLNSISGSVSAPRIAPSEVVNEYYVVIKTISGDIEVIQP